MIVEAIAISAILGVYYLVGLFSLYVRVRLGVQVYTPTLDAWLWPISVGIEVAEVVWGRSSAVLNRFSMSPHHVSELAREHRANKIKRLQVRS